jgi:hypothetical protein
MSVEGLSASASNCVLPPVATPQQASAGAPASSASRMRWTPAENKAPPAGTLSRNSSQSSSQGSSSPIAKLPTLTPLPTKTLAAFEKLQQKLERYDKQDLADYASVLRVSDHTAVLGTGAIMKLPGQIRDAQASVNHAIDTLKTCKTMPSRDQLLAYARIHNKAAAVLEGLKRSRPLPLPRLHEADAMGNLIHGSGSSRKNARWRTASPSQPLYAPVAPAYPRNAAVITANRRLPHEQSYVESLRSSPPPPCPVHSPEKGAMKLNPAAAKQEKNARDARWQGQQIEREKKLWSNATLEKSNMADALGATEEALRQTVAQHRALLSPGKLAAAAKELERLAPLKKKCERFDAKDTSTAARKCWEQARNENIRARNLLDSFGLKKTRLAKPLVSVRLPSPRPLPLRSDNAIPDVDTQTPTTTTAMPSTSPTKKRVHWSPTLVRPVDLNMRNDYGYDSGKSISPDSDSKTTFDNPIPVWARTEPENRDARGSEFPPRVAEEKGPVRQKQIRQTSLTSSESCPESDEDEYDLDTLSARLAALNARSMLTSAESQAESYMLDGTYSDILGDRLAILIKLAKLIERDA